MSRHGETTYADEVMAGGGVCRRYSDGREEWRWRDPEGTVWWRDNRQEHGTDEPLRGGVVKRTHLDGRVLYGRDVGFGWTIWTDGRRTLNRTDAPAGLVALLLRVGAPALLGVVPPPPPWLSPPEQARRRRDGREEKDRAEPDDWTRADDDVPDDFG
jgi:hypothetical protein